MSKQLELHALQQHKKACRLSHADIQEHKKKENLIGYFGLAKLGRPTNKHRQRRTQMPKPAKPNRSQSTQTNVPKMDWSTLSKKAN